MGILRFLLAIAVVIAHSSPIFGISLVGGEIAVKTFFIISGFYMALVLREKYVGVNNSYILFISNRLLKLYPIYWIMLLFSILLSFVTYYQHGLAGSQKINNLVTAISNGSMTIFTFIWYIFSTIFLIFQDWFIFIGLNSDGTLTFIKDFHVSKSALINFIFLPQSWTIGLEILFYLMAPFLVKRMNWELGILFFLSLLLRSVLQSEGFYNDPWSYRFFPCEILYFLIGIFSHRFYLKVKLFSNQRIEKSSTALVIILTIGYQFFNSIAIWGDMYLISVALLIPFVFQHSKNNSFDNKIGELSYPIYMSHITILIIIEKSHLPLIQSLGTTTAMVTVVFSFILNKLVTGRIERYRQKRVSL